jgi:hypothetical protein
MHPEAFGDRVADLLGDSRYLRGVAYGFRKDTDIMCFDV